MNTIRLNRREINRIHELFGLLNESGDYGSVVLVNPSVDSNGIGELLTATFVITHNEIEGEFTVTISDESTW